MSAEEDKIDAGGEGDILPVERAKRRASDELKDTISMDALVEKVHNGPLYACVEQLANLSEEARQERFGKMLDKLVEEKKGNLFYFLGHWRGTVVQYDGATGQVLDQSVIEVKIGLKGTRFSRLAVRKHKDGTINRSFAIGSMRVDGKGQIIAEIKLGDFVFLTYPLCSQLAAFQINATSPNKKVSVHGVVSIIDETNRVSSRQIFLGKRVILEHSREIKYPDTESDFLEEDPDPESYAETNQQHEDNIVSVKSVSDTSSDSSMADLTVS
eukprot:CFRG6695T1